MNMNSSDSHAAAKGFRGSLLSCSINPDSSSNNGKDGKDESSDPALAVGSGKEKKRGRKQLPRDLFRQWVIFTHPEVGEGWDQRKGKSPVFGREGSCGCVGHP